MSKTHVDYERVVEELIKDPESYDSWAVEEEQEDIRSIIDHQVWGDE